MTVYNLEDTKAEDEEKRATEESNEKDEENEDKDDDGKELWSAIAVQDKDAV